MESSYQDDNQLLIQAFRHSNTNLDFQAHEDGKVKRVSEEMIVLKMRELMNELIQVSIIIVDSYSLKKYMSEMGINSRYMGVMHGMTEIPYIQEVLEIEMLARTIKNLYEELVKDIVSDPKFFVRRLYAKKEME